MLQFIQITELEQARPNPIPDRIITTGTSLKLAEFWMVNWQFLS
jgi:hypothetical protein